MSLVMNEIISLSYYQERHAELVEAFLPHHYQFNYYYNESVEILRFRSACDVHLGRLKNPLVHHFTNLLLGPHR